MTSSVAGADVAQSVVVRLLGGFDVRNGNALIVDESWPRAKAKALLKLLALQGRSGMHREQVIETIWPHLSPNSGAANLRKTRHLVRRAWQDAGLEFDPIDTSGETLRLHPDIAIDVEMFREAERAARGSEDQAAYQAALTLHRGSILPNDLYEPWSDVARRDIARRRSKLVRELAELQYDAGNVDAATEALESLLAEDAQDEESALLLQRMRVDSGNQAPTPGPFVGRQREQRELRSALDDALSRSGRIVLIGGEPGMGKTRLAEQFAAEAARRGALPVWARASDDDGAPPYWPWIQALRAYVKASGDRNDTDLAGLTPNRGGPTADPQDRFQLWERVSSYLAAESQRQPTLLIFDDVHWMDADSVRLLKFMARGLAGSRLMVICTFRTTEVTSDDLLSDLIGTITGRSYASTITLAGFDDQEIEAFVEQETKRKPNDALVRQLAERTVGNPLFLREMVQQLVREADREARTLGEVAGSTLPAGVREVIAEHLGRLAPETQRALSLASVWGTDLTLPNLARLAETPTEDLLPAVDEACRHQILVEHDAGTGAYRFGHPLYREVLYTGLSPRQRGELHERAASVIEDVYSAAMSEHLSEVAYHYALATPSEENIRRAVQHGTDAAEHAFNSLAFEDAAHLFRRTLDVLERGLRPDSETRCDLLIRYGYVEQQSRDARHAFVSAANEAMMVDNSVMLARAALGLSANAGVSSVAVDEESVGFIERALEGLPEEEVALRALLLGELATRIEPAGDLARQQALASEALGLGRQAGLDETTHERRPVAKVLVHWHDAFWQPEHLGQRIEAMQEAVDVARSIGHGPLEYLALIRLVSDHLELGDVEAFSSGVDGMQARAEETRVPNHARWAHVLRSTRAALAGEFDEAERLAAEGLRMAEGVDPDAPAIFAAQLFSLRREQGRLDELRDHVTGFLEQTGASLPWLAATSVLYCDLGEHDRAREVFQSAMTTDLSLFPQNRFWTVTVVMLAEACARLGERESAEKLYELLAPYGEYCGVLSFAEVCTGSNARSLGLLATTLERWDDAERHFEDALTMNERMTSPPLVARTKVDYAKMLLGRGEDADQSRAFALLTEAERIARDLGMAGLLRSSESLRAGVSLSS